MPVDCVSYQALEGDVVRLEKCELWLSDHYLQVSLRRVRQMPRQAGCIQIAAAIVHGCQKYVVMCRVQCTVTR